MSETISVSVLYFMLGALLLFPLGYWTLLPARWPRPARAGLILVGMAAFATLSWLLARGWASQARPLLPTLAAILALALTLPPAYRALPSAVLTRPRASLVQSYDLLVPLIAYALAAWLLTALLAVWFDIGLDGRFAWFAVLLAPAACAPALPQPRPFQHGLLMFLWLEWLYAAGCWALVASWTALTPASGTAGILGQWLLACGAVWLLWSFLSGRMSIGGRPARTVVAAALALALRAVMAWLAHLPSASIRGVQRLGSDLLVAAGAVLKAFLHLPSALAWLVRSMILGFFGLLAALEYGLRVLARSLTRLPSLAWHAGCRLAQVLAALLLLGARAAWALPGLVARASLRSAGVITGGLARWAASLRTGWRRAQRDLATVSVRLAGASLALAAMIANLGFILSRWLARLPALLVRTLVSALRQWARQARHGISVAAQAALLSVRELPGLAGRGVLAVGGAVTRALLTAGRVAMTVLGWLASLPAAAWLVIRRLLAAARALAHAVVALPPLLGRGLRLLACGLLSASLAALRMGWGLVKAFGRAVAAVPPLFARAARLLGRGLLLAGAGMMQAARALLFWLAQTAADAWNSLRRLARRLWAALAALAAGLARVVLALPGMLWRGLHSLARGLEDAALWISHAVQQAARWLTFSLPRLVWQAVIWSAGSLTSAGLALARAGWAALQWLILILPFVLWQSVIGLAGRLRVFAGRSRASLNGSDRRAPRRILLAAIAIPAVIVATILFVRTWQAPRAQLRMVAGSGFASFEPLLKRWAQHNGVDLQISYKGSLDIMLMLEKGSLKADAIWDGDSLWTSLGDKQHLIKSGRSIMCSPIVFGVKKSIAEQLGWIGRDVRTQEILDAAESLRLRVLMTSATQSNTGASAFFGFLYAFAGQPDVLTAGHLSDPAVARKVERILNTVNRTSDSSGWMRDLFLNHYTRYDAMFNYESHVLEMNQQLVERGDEPLYIVYPVEGLGTADFPLSFVSQGNEEREPLFEKLQAYLLSDEVQREIAAKGRRTGPLCNQVDPAIFRPQWGADAARMINSFKYPAEPVIRKALALYQTAYRKPSFTVFALDFSGSMQGQGKAELINAMRTLLDQQTAAGYMLQAAPQDTTAVVVFDDTLMNDPEADGWLVRGSDPAALNELLGKIERQPVGHFTNIYLPVERALQLMKSQNTGNAFPAIILMTDGKSNRGSLEDIKQAMAATGLFDVPVYAITFGEADANQLNELADLTAGRVFDGTKDLIGAFRKAKGQN